MNYIGNDTEIWMEDMENYIKKIFLIDFFWIERTSFPLEVIKQNFFRSLNDWRGSKKLRLSDQKQIYWSSHFTSLNVVAAHV